MSHFDFTISKYVWCSTVGRATIEIVRLWKGLHSFLKCRGTLLDVTVIRTECLWGKVLNSIACQELSNKFPFLGCPKPFPLLGGEICHYDVLAPMPLIASAPQYKMQCPKKQLLLSILRWNNRNICSIYAIIYVPSTSKCRESHIKLQIQSYLTSRSFLPPKVLRLLMGSQPYMQWTFYLAAFAKTLCKGFRICLCPTRWRQVQPFAFSWFFF